MKSLIIETNNSGMRLDKFMRKLMSDCGAGEIYKSLRKKKVKVNGKRITDGNYRLNAGDRLELYINDEFFNNDNYKESFWMSLDGKINIVYEDENIIIMNKPYGLLSQSLEENSLEGQMRSYLYKKGEFTLNSQGDFLPSLCHRIDRNTDGLVVGAKNIETLRIINQKIKNRELRKFYLCETQGTPYPLEGEISGWLYKDSKTRKMLFSYGEKSDGVFCKTRYKVIKEGAFALVEAELLTGRTHQIRASFAQLKTPLKGDIKYGAKPDKDRKYQHLTAYKIIFDFTEESGILEYLKGKEIVLTGANISRRPTMICQ